ncbi:YhjD/YihY/BrkB family envelope integrity protein [Candidatus Methylomirabilis sp.]|uniref:YihY family inner membrane protein n=1 Tax=Candidatus Methylomirabilis tolerans TaxID=3123416 RepID=A0AAJ1ERT5_9BACT|nr:YihY family inner membrane protein [Candidatus Methylomirabilis sp.]
MNKLFRYDLWAVELDRLALWERLGVRLLRFVIVAWLEFQGNILSIRATNLVYTTILSLVPFLAVMFSVLKAFGVHQQIEPFLAQVLEPLGERGHEVTIRIIGFVNNLKVGVLGTVGVVTLFWTTFSTIDQIENAFNTIWRVRRSRSFGRKFTDYPSVVLVGPVLVFGAFALIASVQNLWLVQRMLEIQPFGSLIVLGAEILPFIMLCGAFSFLYAFIPNTQVRLSSALVGGLTAGLLWQLAGTAFTAFVAESGRYSAIYSGFAILILFLLWLYIAWIIVLLGAQISYLYQHPSAYLSRASWHRRTHEVYERAGLMVLTEIARRHLAGQPPVRIADLALRLDVPQGVAEELVEEFVHHSLLYRTEDQPGFTLSRPPEHVPIAEVLTLIRTRQQHAAADTATPVPITELLHRRDEAVRMALKGVTLRSLVVDGAPEGFPDPPTW